MNSNLERMEAEEAIKEKHNLDCVAQKCQSICGFSDNPNSRTKESINCVSYCFSPLDTTNPEIWEACQKPETKFNSDASRPLTEEEIQQSRANNRCMIQGFERDTTCTGTINYNEIEYQCSGKFPDCIATAT
ncbi:MAG: hypothetical protein NUV57_04670 [archaeon]|nr:hypothetical protein [archaeon]